MILVVGGHSRNVGKTSVVANLIRSLPQHDWTALKITQFGHGVCSSSGEDCECATDPDHPFVLTREKDGASGADTSRYLDAGARESLWLRTRAGDLGFAVPALKRVLDRSRDVIIESNSVLQFVRPDAYLVVLHPGIAEFKNTSRLYLDRADAFLLAGPGNGAPLQWSGVSPKLLAGRPIFRLGEDYRVTPDLLHFIESRRGEPS